MDRRVILSAFAALPLAARAHHGWSSFDVARPIYLEGKAVNVAWRNPHVELDLDIAPDFKLPADLPQRAVPAQSASVDGAGLLKAAQLPTRKDKRWHIELAPLSRMEAWKAAEIKNGDAISMLGFTFAGEKGDAILRVEYLWAGGKTYALRSSPA
jgi:hypothetical protein